MRKKRPKKKKLRRRNPRKFSLLTTPPHSSMSKTPTPVSAAPQRPNSQAPMPLPKSLTRSSRTTALTPPACTPLMDALSKFPRLSRKRPQSSSRTTAQTTAQSATKTSANSTSSPKEPSPLVHHFTKLSLHQRSKCAKTPPCSAKSSSRTTPRYTSPSRVSPSVISPKISTPKTSKPLQEKQSSVSPQT